MTIWYDTKVLQTSSERYDYHHRPYMTDIILRRTVRLIIATADDNHVGI